MNTTLLNVRLSAYVRHRLYLAGLLLMVLAARPGHAQNRVRVLFDPLKVYSISNERTGRIIEVGGGGNLYNDGQVDIWDYWGGANQQWTFEAVNYPDNGVYIIRNRDTKKVMTAPNPNGGNPTQDFVPGNGPGGAQQWVIEKPGALTILNPGYVASNCIIRLYTNTTTSAGLEQTDYGQVLVTPPNFYSNNYNLWGFKDVSPNKANDFASSVFQIINNNSGKALSMSPDGNSQSVGQMTAWRLGVEEWRLVPSTTTPNYYYIVNRENALVLEIGGNATNNGATLDVANNNQNPWQEWAFLDINDSHFLQPSEFTDGRVFKIYSRTAGKVVEIRNGSTDDGATAAVWNDYSLSHQQWRMQFSAYSRPSGIASTSTTQQPSPSAGIKLSIYPNPTTEAVNLIASGGLDLANSTVNVTDARGGIVQASYRDGKIDVSALATGLYFVTVTDGQQIIRQKFVKK